MPTIRAVWSRSNGFSGGGEGCTRQPSAWLLFRNSRGCDRFSDGVVDALDGVPIAGHEPVNLARCTCELDSVLILGRQVEEYTDHHKHNPGAKQAACAVAVLKRHWRKSAEGCGAGKHREQQNTQADEEERAADTLGLLAL